MTATLGSLPPAFVETRDALHRVAVHVLARRRHALCGRFGLRVTPGGFGTPAAGPEHEVVRVRGIHLVRERTGDASRAHVLGLAGASLVDAAALCDVDLGADFSAGHDTPPVGDPDAALRIDANAARALIDWYELGAAALDAVVAWSAGDAQPTVAQLWPEHFDLSLDVGVGGGLRANVGASPGDAFHADPYVYVGPWDTGRPGDPAFWNAPFGAVLGHIDVATSPDPLGTAVGFLQRGLEQLGVGWAGSVHDG